MRTNNSRKPELDRAKRAKKKAVELLLRRDSPSNVVGVGVGEESGRYLLRIYVVEDHVLSKLGLSKLRPLKRELLEIDAATLLPKDLQDVPIKVIPTQRFGRKGGKPNRKGSRPGEELVTKQPQPGSPIRVRTVVPNVNSGAIGTLGMVVAATGNNYILGCNHILAANGRVREDPTAEIVWAQFVGDQQAIADPGVYFPLDRKVANEVDCALARIRDHLSFQAIFPEKLGALTSSKPIDPERGMPVSKVGSSTGLTNGTINDIDADLYVDYSFGTFRFNNQIIIEGENETFATAGDSGSILVHIDDKETEKKRQAVGMVFAASGRFAVACRLETVLDRLKAKIRDGEANSGKPLKGEVSLTLVTS